MRPVWKGELRIDSFQIPVKLFSATNAKTINLNTFHSVCLSRLVQSKNCPIHGPVEKDEILKGFAVSEKEFVKVDDSDFSQIELTSQTSLEVSQFIDTTEFNPLLVAKSYFVIPDGPVARASYSALRRALTRQGKVALTKILLSRKEYPAAIWCRSRVLVLSALYLASEVKTITEFEELKNMPRWKKAQVAEISALIHQKTAKFQHHRFQDDFERQFQRRIQGKIKNVPGALFQALKIKKPGKKGMTKITPADVLSNTGTDTK